MAKTGWQIAMRRIDTEFDISQNDVSRLVRKIADEFRLPPDGAFTVGLIRRRPCSSSLSSFD